jgi:hypothetical protein
VLRIKATSGNLKLGREEKVNKTVNVAFNATAGTLQTGLESLYGTGNVRVAEGPEEHSWTIAFTGALADQPVDRITVGGNANVTVQTAGRPDGEIVLSAVNVGEAAAVGSAVPVKLSLALPAGVRTVGMSGWAPQPGSFGVGDIPIPCSSGSLTCTFAGVVPPFEHIEVRVDVVVEGGSVEAVQASVSGGGAPSVTSSRALSLAGLPSFGVEDYEMFTEEEGGAPGLQAGSHPFQLTTTVNLNAGADTHGLADNNAGVEPVALAKDINVKLAPGLIGNPQAIPHCTLGEFLTYVENGTLAGGNECPPQTAVGVSSVVVDEPAILGGIATFTQPIFNLEPSFGEPARFGFYVPIDRLPVILDASVRGGNGEDYGITVSALNTLETVGFLDSTLTFWGTPGDPRHDNLRGWNCLQADAEGLPCVAANAIQPPSFVTQPTSCTGPLQSSVNVDSWLQPADSLVFQPNAPLPGMIGCNRLRLDPTIKTEPTTESASSPTGLGFDLDINDEGITAGGGTAESQVKKVVVSLPEGMTANPSLAAGLSACSEAQYVAEGLSSPPSAGCPEESKIGDVEVQSPLLEQTLRGSVYIAKQNENPFHSLLALYVVVRNPEMGVFIKLAGHLEPNQITGQLVSIFEGLPQLPFSHFRLAFRQGQRSPLITPPVCGTYMTQALMYPWSDPENPVQRSASFHITSGVAGSPCPAGGIAPFAPKVTAGTLNNAAGSYSPFDIDITRTDSEQEITGFSSQLPTGLTANLSGVPFCSEAAIVLARTKSGAQEEAEPSCPAQSQIGHTLVGVGVASVLAYTPGKMYMAGPFEGAAFSIVAITSAKVGPFDLGTVIVHLPLQIDPVTAAVSVAAGGSDQIPHIIDGIVVHVRDIRVYVDRPNFTLNPTNCNPLSFSATVIGSGQSFVNPADDDPVTATAPFEVANCANLAFKPSFKVSTSGKTSRTNGASLTVKLAYPKAAQGTQANISKVKVELPKQLPSRLTTLQQACTDRTFNANPAACPAASRVGQATAVTPILPVALTGPAYFVSHGGAKFPELIVVLQGYGVTIDLHGETFISKTGITSSTFRTVPDQPVTSFALTLPQGKYSALAANGNLCASKLRMPTIFVAQNGATIKQNTPISVTGCAKKKAKRAIKHKKK